MNSTAPSQAVAHAPAGGMSWPPERWRAQGSDTASRLKSWSAILAGTHLAKDKPTPLPPFGPRVESRLPALVRRRARQGPDRRGGDDALAEEHMELCASSAAGESPYTWAQDARLAAIARETMVQAWEAVEQHLLRTIGSSAVKSGQRFERLFRDLATMAAHRNTMLREDFWRQLGAIDLGVSYPSPGGTWPPSPDTTARDRV